MKARHLVNTLIVNGLSNVLERLMFPRKRKREKVLILSEQALRYSCKGY